MLTIKKQKFSCLLEDTFEELYKLASLIKLTKEVCLDQEFSSKYYHLPEKDKVTLSEERNHYINMLTIAQDKISHIIQNSIMMENELPKL